MKDCIEWQKSRNKAGYGTRSWLGKNRLAHRVAYIEHHGLSLADISGKVIRHKCDNRGCVNPEHLQLGTQADNIKDSWGRGRGVNPSFKGSIHPASKLTESQVSEIRSRYVLKCRNNGCRSLAIEYGVSQATIRDIISRRTWPHI